MKNKFTFKEAWMMFWGLGYRVNHAKKEIHKLDDKHKNCLHEAMSKKTTEYITNGRALKLLKLGYNGCRWCWEDADQG
ncbi:MAG: hypothetical protein JZU47_01095 [Prolixibacteraceae bacterium]|nr:hypothetical protein [Prolixibacteraceae bacterium]